MNQKSASALRDNALLRTSAKSQQMINLMYAPDNLQSNPPDIIKIILIQPVPTRYLDPLSCFRAWFIKPNIQQSDLQSILSHQIGQLLGPGRYWLLTQEHK